jgi:hypothetical protein
MWSKADEDRLAWEFPSCDPSLRACFSGLAIKFGTDILRARVAKSVDQASKKVCVFR